MTEPRIRCLSRDADGVTPSGHYAHAVVAGGFVFVSGQLPVAPGKAPDPSLSMREQTTLALQNLARALAVAGAQPTDVVKVTAFLVNESDWDDFDAAYAAFFGAHRPARAAVPVGPLYDGLRLEVEAVAYVGGR